MKHFLKYAFVVGCACLALSVPTPGTLYAAERDTAPMEGATQIGSDTPASEETAQAGNDTSASEENTQAGSNTTASEENTQAETGLSDSGESTDETTDIDSTDSNAATSETTKAKKVSIRKCTISLSKTTYIYNGKEKKPSVTVTYDGKKLKKNKDYSVSYSDNVEIGSATVTITGINGYKGSVTKTYKILPKTTSAVNAAVDARKIVVTWKKTSNVDGYILYRRVKGTDTWKKLKTFSNDAKRKYTDTACSFGKKYEYAVRTFKTTASGTVRSDYSKAASCTFRPEAPTITQLMTLSKDTFSIRWNLVEEADGYIIYQKVNGKWKKVSTVAASATSHCTIQNLTYNKTYTFAVRAYWKAADGTIQLGARSEPYKEKLYYKVTYENGYRLYYDASGDLITDVEGIIGPQKSYSIQVNRTTNTVTVFAPDPEKTDCSIPVKSFLCSTGKATPKGTFRTSEKYRWHPLIHNVFGQWSTRITGSILFHSVYYGKNYDANSLDVIEFNKLGTAASAGCVRLNCADVKWIYDNCGSKTKVTIYDDANPGPFGYPEQILLDEDHTWDPTDPEMKYLCTQNGCHQE
jgi:hypothetical protein